MRSDEGPRQKDRTRQGESARPNAPRPSGGGARRDAAARCDGESRRDADRATVLAVDDEPSLAALYESWLGGRFEVETVHTGEAALDRLTGEVDVVVLDRQLPGIDGDEVLRRIEGSPFEPRVAMVSALEPDAGAIGAEPDEYLVKPVDRGLLTRTIESLAADGDRAASDGRR